MVGSNHCYLSDFSQEESLNGSLFPRKNSGALRTASPFKYLLRLALRQWTKFRKKSEIEVELALFASKAKLNMF